MSRARPLRVVIAGGGTGGHLYPGIAVARTFQARKPDAVITFAGTTRGIEATVVPREGFELDVIRSAGLKGKSARDLIVGIGMLPASAVDAWQLLSRRRPDLVIGLGGYSSGPVVLVASLRGMATMLLEQNAVPGLANRLLGRVVRAAAVTYQATLPYFGSRGFVSGNPVRSEFFGEPRNRPAGGRLKLLAFGGSQGAHALNVAMVEAAVRLSGVPDHPAITHQTGERDLEFVRQGYSRARIAARVEPFLYDMAGEMHTSDLIVCRAGATTLAELAAAGKPAILVPLPTATDDHQRRNAQLLADAGAATIVLQVDLTGERLAGEILRLLRDASALGRMATTVRQFARPEAAARIVDRALSLMGEYGG
jgi:UDP-N-acetylglucosamine--N-acetylmuramyl-(pentapeptide) pyrophosphoryl-undecaprenol N-acetylglucosamine transferase